MSASKSKQLAIDTILFGISTFGSKILVFLLTPLYTAVLLTEEYGIADLVNTTVNLIYPILTLAITDATLRYALDRKVSKSAVLGNSLVITVLSIILLMAFYPILKGINSEIAVQLTKYWGYFVLNYATYNIHLCFSNFIKGIGKTKLYAIQGILQTLTVVVCNIYFLLFAKMGLEGYLLSVIIGFIIPTLLILFAGGMYKYIFPLKLEKKLLADMLKYSLPMIPTLLSWSINLYINKYMLIGMLPSGEGLGASGIFSVANKIPSVLTAILGIFTQAWQLSAIANVNDADESDYYTEMYGAMHIVSLLGCMVIIPFSKWISALLFDPAYYTAWQHIPFLMLSAFYSCLSGFLASAFRAYKKTSQLFTSVAIGAVANIVLNFVLINAIGVIGASIATAASFFITWVVRIVTIQPLVEVKISVVRTIATYVAIIAASALISFDIPGAYICYVIACAVIFILNYPDIKAIVLSVMSTAKKMLKRRTAN